MSIVVNTNTSATTASFNLSRANDSLRKSLARLSSGNRIVSPADDAGGLAVAYKLSSSLKRVEAVRNNVQNGVSYLQAQDGVLQVAGTVLDRMSELRTMAQDVTKNTQDVENYSKEFLELQRQLSQIYREKFNGISLFAISSAKAVNHPPDLRPQLSKATTKNDEGNDVAVFSRTLYTHESGQRMDGNVSLSVLNFETIFDLGELDSRYIEDFDGNSVNLANAADLNKDNYPTVSVGSTTGGGAGAGGAGGSSATPAPSGAALWMVGGYGTLQVLSKAAIQTEGNNWRIRIRDDMPGTTGGLPSLGIGPDPKDPLLTLFTMDLPDNVTNYEYDFLETYAPDYFQVSLHATASLGTKFAAYLGSANNDPIHNPGGNPGVQDVWDDDGHSSDSGFEFGGGYVPVPTSGGSGSGGSTSGSGSSGPLTTTGVASTAMENDEVFTDDGFLSSIMFVSVGQFTSVIERIADARAENGAEQSRLNMSSELLTRKQTNLEAAHGRIMDADIALESTRFARHNVLVQASAAMTAQANQLTNVVLTLLG